MTRGRGARGAGPPVRGPGGRLLVVATPLGNLGDMTPRAVEALRGSDLVACEDTRRTRILLSHFGLSVPVVSCHKFNEASRVEEILAAIRSGSRVSLVTDAGTPGVSDPGARLVAAAHRAGLNVEAIPGPSAPAAAVSVSGFEAGGFVFAGYPPARSAARRRFFRALRMAEEARSQTDPRCAAWPIVFFEAPHRVEACLGDLMEELGDRMAVLIREMTKVHEETLQGSLREVAKALAARPRRGEFTLVVEGSARSRAISRAGGGDLEAAYRDLLAAGVDRREALRRLARETGARRRDLYGALLGSGERPGDEAE